MSLVKGFREIHGSDIQSLHCLRAKMVSMNHISKCFHLELKKIEGLKTPVATQLSQQTQIKLRNSYESCILCSKDNSAKF